MLVCLPSGRQGRTTPLYFEIVASGQTCRQRQVRYKQDQTTIWQAVQQGVHPLPCNLRLLPGFPGQFQPAPENGEEPDTESGTTRHQWVEEEVAGAWAPAEANEALWSKLELCGSWFDWDRCWYHWYSSRLGGCMGTLSWGKGWLSCSRLSRSSRSWIWSTSPSCDCRLLLLPRISVSDFMLAATFVTLGDVD